MDVVVTDGYISYKGKLYHTGDLIHLPKTAAQKFIDADLAAQIVGGTKEPEEAPADNAAEEELEELPAPDMKKARRK